MVAFYIGVNPISIWQLRSSFKTITGYKYGSDWAGSGRFCFFCLRAHAVTESTLMSRVPYEERIQLELSGRMLKC